MFIETEQDDMAFFLELAGFVVLLLLSCNLFLETFVYVVAPSISHWGALTVARVLAGGF